MNLKYEHAHIQLYTGQAQHGAYYIEQLDNTYLATACILADTQKVLGYEYFQCKKKAIDYLKGWDNKIA